MNMIEGPEINPHIHRKLLYDKGAKSIQQSEKTQ